MAMEHCCRILASADLRRRQAIAFASFVLIVRALATAAGRALSFGVPERQAELLCAALARLGIERALVLGHSWGALVALAMARHNSERVKGLVLISGYYFPTWRFDVWFASVAAIPLVGDALRYTISPISTWLALPVFAKKTFAPRPVPDIVKTTISSADADPTQPIARRRRRLGIHVAIRGKDHDVLSSP